MEGSKGDKQGESGPGVQTPLCRFYSQGRHCNFGKKCRFLHVRGDEVTGASDQLDAIWPNPETDEGPVGQRPPRTFNCRTAPAAGRRTCRYFLSGHCAMEDRCRFWHPQQLPPVGDQPMKGNHTRQAPGTIAAKPPTVLQVVKLSEMTEEVAKKLRDTEITQLKKRFPKDQLIIQEQSDGSLTYYRATVTATDPDWVFFFLFSSLFFPLILVLMIIFFQWKRVHLLFSEIFLVIGFPLLCHLAVIA